MSDSFYNSLHDAQRQAILAKNAEFESAWKKTLNTFLASIDMDAIRETFVTEINENPFRKSVQHTLRMSMDGILVRGTQRIENGAVVTQTAPEGPDVPVCTFAVLDPIRREPYIVSHACISGVQNDDFDDYILGKMEPVRSLLRSACPRADIEVSIEHWAIETFVVIQLSYTLSDWHYEISLPLGERIPKDEGRVKW